MYSTTAVLLRSPLMNVRSFAEVEIDNIPYSGGWSENTFSTWVYLCVTSESFPPHRAALSLSLLLLFLLLFPVWLPSAPSALPRSASWPFWFCPCILPLFSNILPLVIWPTFYLRILPSSVSGSLKSSRFSQVCLVILLFPSHWDELCVFTPFILFLYENRSPFLEFIIK